MPGAAHDNTTAGRTPIPDPTLLTTQQLLREISNSREMATLQINSARDVLEQRLHGMDLAIKLVQSIADKAENEVKELVGQLRQLHEERFRSVEKQFVERDTRTDQTSRDSKVAVDAALQAAKEAVSEQNKSNALAIGKSEMTFTKQIDQIGALLATMQKAADDKIDDMKSRIQSIEGQRKGSGDLVAYIFGIVGMIAAVVAIVVALGARH